MTETYRTSAAYAAVTAIAGGRQQVTLVVAGHLSTPRARIRVHQQIRRHARALGVQAHAEWVACREGATEFTVRPGPGRKLLTPALHAAVLTAWLAGGVTQRQVAARFGISQSSVHKIVQAKGGGT